MVYRFKLDEDIGDGFIRIGLEQIGKARRGLEEAADPALAVHETRKGLKRIRALLRLARPGLKESVFRRENARCRDIAALLAGARDAHVLMETADMLDQRRAHGFEKAAIAALREALASQTNGAGESSGRLKTTHAIAGLGAARKAFKKIEVTKARFATLAEGLETSYRMARRAFGEAYATKDDEAFHEWRKGAQWHWRHMGLLSRGWPDMMEARAAEARQLSQILGEDHDLFVLAAEARAHLGEKHTRAIDRLRRARQDELRTAAFTRGQRLFAEKPRQLRRRAELYWRAAENIAAENGWMRMFQRDADSVMALDKRH